MKKSGYVGDRNLGFNRNVECVVHVWKHRNGLLYATLKVASGLRFNIYSYIFDHFWSNFNSILKKLNTLLINLSD